jgi:hypothetical protein
MSLDSMPVELDEITRKIMQLDIEIAALKNVYCPCCYCSLLVVCCR